MYCTSSSVILKCIEVYCTSSSVHRNSVQGIIQLRSEDIITIEADWCVDIIIMFAILMTMIIITKLASWPIDHHSYDHNHLIIM